MENSTFSRLSARELLHLVDKTTGSIRQHPRATNQIVDFFQVPLCQSINRAIRQLLANGFKPVEYDVVDEPLTQEMVEAFKEEFKCACQFVKDALAIDTSVPVGEPSWHGEPMPC